MVLGCYQSVVVGELDPTPPRDAGPPEAEMRAPLPDAMAPPVDLGAPEADLGPPEPDLGPPSSGFPVEISTGVFHSCLLFETGRVACWGDDLGPTAMVLPRRGTALFDGSCVNLEGGGYACGSTRGIAEVLRRVDDERVPDSRTLTAVSIRPTGSDCRAFANGTAECGGPGVRGDVVDVASGFSHFCLLNEAGEVRCFGNNEASQCGQPPSPLVEVPTLVRGLPPVQDIAAGGEHTCALASGRVYCWGRGAEGQLGDGRADHGRECVTLDRTIDCTETPVEVFGVGDAVEVAGTAVTTCVRRASGEIACFGSDDFGSLGSDEPTTEICDGIGCTLAPQTVSGIDDAISLRGGDAHFCAVSRARVRCWGLGRQRQLFTGTIAELARAAGL